MKSGGLRMTDSADQLAAVRKLKSEKQALESEVARLKSGGGGGTLPPVDVIDAKISASEARTDTKFAELRGDLAKFATKGTVWGAVATALGIVLAVAALAGNRFDAGMTTRGAVDGVVVEQHRRDDAQDSKLDQILERLPAPAPSVFSPAGLGRRPGPRR